VLTSSRDLAELALLATLFVVALWVVLYVHRKRGASATLRVLAALTSLAAGVGLCFVPYQPSASLRLVGFPLPLVVFQLEHGSWVDYVASRNRLVWIGVLIAGVVHTGVAVWWRLRHDEAGHSA
jgi:hypothetical protein